MILVRSRRNFSCRRRHITRSSFLSVSKISQSFCLLDTVCPYHSTRGFFSVASCQMLGSIALHQTGSDLDSVTSHNLVTVSTTLVSRPSHCKLQLLYPNITFLTRQYYEVLNNFTGRERVPWRVWEVTWSPGGDISIFPCSSGLNDVNQAKIENFIYIPIFSLPDESICLLANYWHWWLLNNSDLNKEEIFFFS